ATAGEKALLRLSLDQVLTAGDGIGQARARRITTQVVHILAVTEGHTSSGRVPRGYILDERARGRRLLAVLDAFISHGLIREVADVPVWNGFPFAPRPVDAKEANQRSGRSPPLRLPTAQRRVITVAAIATGTHCRLPGRRRCARSCTPATRTRRENCWMSSCAPTRLRSRGSSAAPSASPTLTTGTRTRRSEEH